MVQTHPQTTRSHRTWEDWLSIAFAALLVASPWITGEAMSNSAMVNLTVTATLIVGFAALELVELRRWEEIGEIIFGLWIATSPLVFGYATQGTLRYWHGVLGGLVVLLAVIELWQDRQSSEADLAHHGW
ncbi:MAG: SPW repeat protein [Pseudomonadota bacterium]|nr:SPW repeat protein [Pseudomonadota bacterium]